jgi:CheY-like chemotaxis protein
MTIPLPAPHVAAKQGTKMLSNQRLLIIEDVFLIALDIQRIVEGANARQAVFARNFREAQALADRFAEFDLAIVNPPSHGSPEMEVAALLVASGAPIVVCTAARIDLAGTPLAEAEVITKPFSDENLLTASQRALARRNG